VEVTHEIIHFQEQLSSMENSEIKPLNFEKLKTGRVRNISKLGIHYVLKHYKYVRFGIKWAQDRQKKAKFPLNLIVEPTNRCELKCVFCARQIMTRKQGDMKLSLFKSVIDSLLERNCLPYHMLMHFYGESLLNPDLCKMIRYAKDAGVPIVRYNTHGTFLDNTKCLEILRSGLDILDIVVGPTKEIHNKVRLGSDLDLVERNIMRLKSLRKGQRPPLYGEMLAMKGVTSQEDLQSGFEKWSRIFDLFDVVPAATIGGQVPDYDPRPRPKDFCREIWTNSVILWNGDVTVCCVDSNAQLVVGNVNDDSLVDIWNNRKYENLREIHRRREYFKVPLCEQCMMVR
jgi:radical SAM protein with 4Fe4S-binding SPASM domain